MAQPPKEVGHKNARFLGAKGIRESGTAFLRGLDGGLTGRQAPCGQGL